MIVPVSTAPSCRPMIVTTGIRLLRSAWAMTARSARDATRARRQHVQLAQFVDQTGPRHARQHRGERGAQRDGRQHEVGRRSRCPTRATIRAARQRRSPAAGPARSSASQYRRATPSSPPGRSLVPEIARRCTPSGSAIDQRHGHRGQRELRRAAEPLADFARAPACCSETRCRDRPARGGRGTPVLREERACPARACDADSSRSAAGADSPSIAWAGSPGTR